MRRLIQRLVLLALAACSDNAGPATAPAVPTSQLHFVLQDPAAPPLAASSGSFLAKVGENRELRLFYQNGQEFMRFEVPSDGLWRKPDGSSFQPGEEILITVTIVDPARFVFDFEPTGLQFNPSDQARLKIYYYNADHDFNGDGTVDAEDARIESQLDIWRREPPDTVWFRLGAVNFESSEELNANIASFTDHAVAW
ncbi:MAG: hypothetical protein E6K12_03740 [Methanobacteriota archaeon]|nr:MAG: hypothetical protein E6K12_03740 [Euryarchaeota archaeon]